MLHTCNYIDWTEIIFCKVSQDDICCEVTLHKQTYMNSLNIIKQIMHLWYLITLILENQTTLSSNAELNG